MTDTPDNALAPNSSTSSGLSGAQIVAEMQKFIGDEYVYGAAGPTTFDCSGLVQYGLEQLGLSNVPRTSEAQYSWVSKTSTPVAGELVFENFPGEVSPGHVGIAINATQMIDAPFTGAKVRVDPIDKQALVGYGVIPTSSVDASDNITTDSILSNPLSPSSWISAIGGALSKLWPGGFEQDAEKLGQRVMFWIGGFILVIFGIVIFARDHKSSGRSGSNGTDNSSQDGSDSDSGGSPGMVSSPEKVDSSSPNELGVHNAQDRRQTHPMERTVKETRGAGAARDVGVSDALEAAALA
jgi:hypothetical protein